MTRWRWQIWLPRAMFVAVALLTCQYALGLLTRSKVIGSLQSSVGARTELGHGRVSVLDRKVVLRRLEIADPRQPFQNLVEADRCEFDVALGPLVHKQTLIERGSISGLRFGTPRDESGALAGRQSADADRPIQWFNDDVNRRTQEWLEHVNRRFDADLIDQFESIKQTASLCDRVPQRAKALEARVQELTQRAEELQARLNAALANPLRHASLLRAAGQEIPALERDFAMAAAELEQLPDLVDAERRGIVAARRRDEEWLRGQLRLPPVDQSELTTYLLQHQVARPLDELIGWMRFERRLFPTSERYSVQAGQRGQDVLFAGCPRSASLLIRELALTGMGRIGGQPIAWRGTLSDFASTPSVHERPLRIKIGATGSMHLVLQGTIDRREAVARDELLIDCQNVVLPPTELGSSDELRLMLAPSTGTLSISLSLNDKQLSGDIQLVQKQVQIVPCLGGDLDDVPVTAVLEETIKDVESLATRISLSGTLDEPSCRLWSNLGPALAEALDRALRKAAEQHARRMMAESQRRIDQQLTHLERLAAESQAKLRPQLSQVTGRLAEIAAQQKPPQRITPEHVGRRLPANSLLR